jgi:hypothetical protein
MPEKRLSLKVVLKGSASSNSTSGTSSKSLSASASTASSIYDPEEEEIEKDNFYDSEDVEELSLSSGTRQESDQQGELELDFESGVEELPMTPQPLKIQAGKSLNIRIKAPLKREEPDYYEDEEFVEEEERRGVDTTRLTARQRAKLEKVPTIPDELTQSQQSQLQLLGKRGLTEEEQMKRLEESKRRKDQREQKLEETKMATIQRLLKKQSARSKKIDNLVNKNNVEKSEKEVAPNLNENANFIYKSGKTRSILLVRKDHLSPFLFNQTRPPVAEKKDLFCKICGAERSCWHSKLHIPLCQNIACHKQVNQ